jgi:hypothetical protein
MSLLVVLSLFRLGRLSLVVPNDCAAAILVELRRKVAEARLAPSDRFLSELPIFSSLRDSKVGAGAVLENSFAARV